MNAITVGKYVDVHDEDLPAFATLLSGRRPQSLCPAPSGQLTQIPARFRAGTPVTPAHLLRTV
jgi:hypothetical protein